VYNKVAKGFCRILIVVKVITIKVSDAQSAFKSKLKP